jgi:DNA-binding LytR/AlgR family response regulator
MAEQNQSTETTAEQPKFTDADVAKLVKREVVEVIIDPKTKQPKLDEHKRPVTRTVEIEVKADEVLAFAVRGNEVTVVTVDGQKLLGNLAA